MRTIRSGCPVMTDVEIPTKITRLLGIRVPIVQAGMSWASSSPALPLAVSRAGGPGVLAAGPMRMKDFTDAVDVLRAALPGPFAVNLPLYRPPGRRHHRLPRHAPGPSNRHLPRWAEEAPSTARQFVMSVFPVTGAGSGLAGSAPVRPVPEMDGPCRTGQATRLDNRRISFTV
ncbi:nitronate monooxygenase [Rhodococcus koreensis]|uniref:nitronate monooxygenase n=1 Tax=Rhodococcus koreensis TaxID=99653 RepID=UPI00366B9992